MTPTGLACSKKEWMKFTASTSARSVSAPTVPPGMTRPSYSSAETSEKVFSTVKVSPGFTSLFMVWASPVSMPTTSTEAPASSTAFLGSVNSTCSVPTGARSNATLRPCNSFATMQPPKNSLLAFTYIFTPYPSVPNAVCAALIPFRTRMRPRPMRRACRVVGPCVGALWELCAVVRLPFEAAARDALDDVSLGGDDEDYQDRDARYHAAGDDDGVVGRAGAL